MCKCFQYFFGWRCFVFQQVETKVGKHQTSANSSINNVCRNMNEQRCMPTNPFSIKTRLFLLDKPKSSPLYKLEPSLHTSLNHPLHTSLDPPLHTSLNPPLYTTLDTPLHTSVNHPSVNDRSPVSTEARSGVNNKQVPCVHRGKVRCQ